jgi:aerobic carbon-monoxide dehydrogenase small subunit
MHEPVTAAAVSFTVNGRIITATPEADELLCDTLRERLDLAGTRVGCREGVCGSCNVLVNATVVRSCLMLAVQAEGCDIRTVEGLSADGELSNLQQAFLQHGAVQCGFCTPGVLVAATALLESAECLSEADIVEAIAGNLCRCTGYSKILAAIRAVAENVRRVDRDSHRRDVAEP